MADLSIPADDVFELNAANKRAWHSPTKVLDHYLRLVKKHGLEKIDSNNQYQKVREMKAVALFLLGIIKNQKREFWLQSVINETRPDVRTFCLDNTRLGPVNQLIQEVEVTTYEKHSHDDLVNFITRTKLLKKKNYSALNIILCELRKNFRLPPLKTLNWQFRKINPKSNIVIIGRINPVREIYRIANIYPEIELVEDFNAIDEAKALHRYFVQNGRHHTIRLSRSTKSEIKFTPIPGKAPGPFDDFLNEND